MSLQNRIEIKVLDFLYTRITRHSLIVLCYFQLNSELIGGGVEILSEIVNKEEPILKRKFNCDIKVGLDAFDGSVDTFFLRLNVRG